MSFRPQVASSVEALSRNSSRQLSYSDVVTIYGRILTKDEYGRFVLRGKQKVSGELGVREG